MCNILPLIKVPPPTNAWHSPFNTCQRPKYVWNSPGPVMVPVKVCTLPWFPCHLSSSTANPVICRLSLQILSFVVYHCKSCHLTSITANPVICRLSLQILSIVVYHCKSCHLSSVTANPVTCRLSLQVHAFSVFPVLTFSVLFFLYSFIYLFSPVPSCFFLSCGHLSCLPVVPVLPSCLSTDLISDDLQCLNDGDVSQLLGNAQGRLSILQKKIKRMVKFRKKCREVQVWGSGSPLLKSRIRILPFLISIITIQILTRPKYAAFLIVGLHKGLSSYRRSLQPPRREHPALQKITLFNFFLLTRIQRPNWIRIKSRIPTRIHNTDKNCPELESRH